MKAIFLFSVMVIFTLEDAISQYTTMQLFFTGADSSAYVQLDSIKVMNKTMGGDTMLYYPDTVLLLQYATGIQENGKEAARLQWSQNFPNPVIDVTFLSLYVPVTGRINLLVTDVLGKVVIHAEYMLDKGYHSFRFTPGRETVFFVTAQWKNQSDNIKILHPGIGSCAKGSLEYLRHNFHQDLSLKMKSLQEFMFDPGDQLLYIGYSGGVQSGTLDFPVNTDTTVFQFATNIPCPSSPTVTYGGQVYNTIQIFSQCWLKENLNIGTMIPSTQQMGNNGVIEKYCYGNTSSNCGTYGGLYRWDEAMQYTNQQGAQGICPSGWHIPTDEEWKVLEGSVDSQYGIGDTTWNSWGVRGWDSGKNLKSTTKWWGLNGIDLYGFNGLPAGLVDGVGGFIVLHVEGFWWSTRLYVQGNPGSAWYRSLRENETGSNRDNFQTDFSFSVRCLKDN